MRCAFLMVSTALLVAACASSNRDTYSKQDVGRSMEMTRGTVVSARPVHIQGESSGLGAAAGGIAAGTIGYSTIGSDSGAAIAGVLLGIAGAVVGALVEQAVTSESGTEYTVQMNDGRTITIVQNEDGAGETIAAGTPVLVQWAGEYSRVIPDQASLSPAAGPPPPATGSETPPASTPSPPAAGQSTPPATGGPAPQDWVNPDTLPPGKQTGAKIGGVKGPPAVDDRQTFAPHTF
jgi:outer membrane lipoprotein SlyB